MSLASVLSKEEQGNSLREAIKRVKKSVPPPKYMCLPSTAQIQQRVHLVDSSNELCVDFQNLVKQHGVIPELDNCKSAASVKQLYAGDQDQESGCVKLSAMRRVVERHVKDAWMDVACHRLFWSHIVIGINAVIRRLQHQRIASQPVDSKPDAIPLCCVLLDAGWLASQLGHHIAHLCCAAKVRLISVRPPGTLVHLATSQVRSCKSAMAIGVCESIEGPDELITWLSKVRSLVPLLHLPGLTFPGVVAQPILRADVDRSLGDSVRQETFQEADSSYIAATAHTETETIETNGESWDDYSISEPSRLYVFPAEFQDVGQVFTVSELFSHLVSQDTSVHLGEEDVPRQYIPSISIGELGGTVCTSDQEFAPTVVKIVEAQTDRSLKKKNGKKKTKRKCPTEEVIGKHSSAMS